MWVTNAVNQCSFLVLSLLFGVMFTVNTIPLSPQHTSEICHNFCFAHLCLCFLFLLLPHFGSQGIGAVWKRDYSTKVLRIPSCSLPSMATFVSPSKPNFKVISTRDPTPLISYHNDSWSGTCNQNSLMSTPTAHTHEMRASVIMKTSDVTSSWPLTSDLA